MPPVPDFLLAEYFGNTLLDWGLAALAFLFTFLVLPFVRGRLRKAAARLSTQGVPPPLELVSALIGRTSRLLLLIVALYFAEKILALPARVDRVFDFIIVIGLWMQVGIWGVACLRFFVQRRAGLRDSAASSSIDVLVFVGQLLVWAVVALLALDNLGINITALVAGLGVGGIAVALAVQTILGDLFGSLSIAFDKPFTVGDLLRIDDFEGTVEHIGIKSTRLRSVTGEQIVLSNADVLKSRVRNLGRMTERRVLFRLQVAYEAGAGAADVVPGIVEHVVRAQPDARFVQCLLVNLGPYALEFETIYFLDNRAEVSPPCIAHEVNRALLREFAAAGVPLAYPTQRVLHEPSRTGDGG
jgi:small-conductance mechanosensitive channel